MRLGPVTIHQPLPTQRVDQIDPYGPFVMNTQA